MDTWVIAPQQINRLDQKDENQEIFQKCNIILGQERKLVNHLTRPFTCQKDLARRRSLSDLHQSDSFGRAVKTRMVV